MKRGIWILSVLIILGALGPEVLVGKPLVLDSNFTQQKIGLHISFLEDKERQYSLQEVVSPPVSEQFVPSDRAVLNCGFTDAAYWVRFTVVNPGSKVRPWLLEVAYPMLDRITLFVQKDGRFEARESGDMLPFKKRPVGYRNAVFPLETGPDDPDTYFMRFSTGSAMNINLTAWSPKAFEKKRNSERILSSAFFGAIVVMIFYNLLLFVASRVFCYLYHALFVSASALFLFTLYGLAFQYLWPESIWWANTCMPILVFLCNISCVVFARSFLLTKQETPAMDKVFAGYILFNCLALAVSPFLNYASAIRIATVLAVLAALLPLAVSARLSFDSRQARFYLIAWLFLFFGITVYGLKTFGVLPSHFVTEYAMISGLLLETVLLSLGVGDKINTTQRRSIMAQERALMIQQQAFEQQQAAEKEKEHLEGQVRQAQKMEAIGHLAGGIAHDFNNILTIITGNIELAAMGRLEKETAERLQHIKSASQRAEDLISQILTFSRKNMTDSASLQPVGVDTIVKEVSKFIRTTIPAGIEVDHLVNAKDGRVLAEPTGIHQVLMNLCTNAKFAMEKSGGRLRIETGVVEADAMYVVTGKLSKGRYVAMSVSDTGEGMAPDVVNRIFEPYYTTREKGKGTGLGLSTVHGIVKSYDGEIDVKSSVGKGTTFTVYLPVKENGGRKPGEKAEKRIVQGRRRILFLDDEEKITDIYGKLIKEKYGWAVETFNSPLAALDAYDPGRFDVVVTDFQMPKMSGVKVAEKILEINGSARIILCSGDPGAISERWRRKTGVNSVIKKPINDMELAFAVEELMDVAGTGRDWTA